MFFAEKRLSRQRKWQLKQQAAGRCKICGRGPVFKRGMCFEHYKKYVLDKELPQPNDPLPA